MKVCPNCRQTVKEKHRCPHCQTSLVYITDVDADADKVPSSFQWHYILYAFKISWMSWLSLLLCAIRLIGWPQDFGVYGVYVFSLCVLSIVFAVIQYRNFGKYSRYFHPSKIVRFLTVFGKYVFAVIAVAFAYLSILA